MSEKIELFSKNTNNLVIRNVDKSPFLDYYANKVIKMEQLIYAFCSGVTSPETLILVESIREFGGDFSNNPIWLFTKKTLDEIPKDLLSKLEQLNVNVYSLEIDPEIANFRFIEHVYAAAKAEEMALKKTENLVFLGTNSLFFDSPRKFLLEEGINLGYRPVHHKLIGSLYDEPIDYFWSLIYQKCDVNQEKVFPMQTHVDGQILRPYISSGCLIVNPERGFFKAWWDRYKIIHKEPIFKEFYEKYDLYVVFIHQAVLSAVMLSELDPEEIMELPFNYNYPINLYHESLEEFKPKNFEKLVTARYYLEKIVEEDEFNKIPFTEPMKSWLEKRIVVKD